MKSYYCAPELATWNTERPLLAATETPFQPRMNADKRRSMAIFFNPRSSASIGGQLAR
jgi:hypothetical protein